MLCEADRKIYKVTHFTLGKFKTTCGMDAFIAQVKSSVRIGFVMKGVIRSGCGKILFLHLWNSKGKSLTQDSDYDLVKTNEI